MGYKFVFFFDYAQCGLPSANLSLSKSISLSNIQRYQFPENMQLVSEVMQQPQPHNLFPDDEPAEPWSVIIRQINCLYITFILKQFLRYQIISIFSFTYFIFHLKEVEI